MAISTCGVSRHDEPGINGLRLVHHDLSRPVIGSSSVAGFTLDTRKPHGTRRMAASAFAIDLRLGQCLRCSSMVGNAPRLIDGAMTQFAFFSTNEHGLGMDPCHKGRNEAEPGRYDLHKAHVYRSKGLSTNPRFTSRCTANRRPVMGLPSHGI
jgi:hypothetical protein